MNVVQVGDRTRMVLNLRNMVTYETQVEGNNVNIVLTPMPVTAARPTPRAERFAEGTADVEARDPRRRLPPRPQRRRPRRRRPLRHHHRHRHPPAGPAADRRLPEDLVCPQPAQAPRRAGLRHAGLDDQHVPAGRERAHGDRAEGAVGALRLPDRQPVRHRGEAGPGRPEQARAGHARRLQGREAVAQLPERRSARVLQVIADFTGLNIITSDTVQGNLTLRLKDVPWDQALDIILQTQGLDMRKNGNVSGSRRATSWRPRRSWSSRPQQQISELEPLRTETFQLNYTKAAELVIRAAWRRDRGRGRGHQHPILSKRGSAVADPRTNIAVRAGHPVAAGGGAQDDLDHRHRRCARC